MEYLQCPNCAGTGMIERPTIREKIERHVLFAAAHMARTGQESGLMLTPAEAAELADELGIPAPQAQTIRPGDPMPSGGAQIDAHDPELPLDADAAAGPAEPEAARCGTCGRIVGAPTFPCDNCPDRDTYREPHFGPDGSRTGTGVDERPATAEAEPERPTIAEIPAPGEAGASLTGPPGA